MLPKKHRLTKKKDFGRVFKQGKHYQQDFISLKINKNNLEFSRFGFIVGLKISKKAVVRNKIRRRLSEIIRLKFKQISSGFDIVILTQPEIIGKSYQETEESLVVLFRKSKLLK